MRWGRVDEEFKVLQMGIGAGTGTGVIKGGRVRDSRRLGNGRKKGSRCNKTREKMEDQKQSTDEKEDR
jgi:hypothetical protein